MQEAQRGQLMKGMSEGMLCAYVNNNMRCYNESTEFADLMEDSLEEAYKVTHPFNPPPPSLSEPTPNTVCRGKVPNARPLPQNRTQHLAGLSATHPCWSHKCCTAVRMRPPAETQKVSKSASMLSHL